METVLTITNGLSGIAFLACIGLVILVAKEGQDERARLLGYKLFSFLFVFLIGGLSLIICYTGWKTIDYVILRICMTTLMSLTIFVGLFYWMIIRKKY
ncbi:hypothetical protein [Cohnella nanjingensis]|uniref:LanY n=1 Tax=Cohnella nanjingensis TaxID=1387779 RepID=A0A7X0RXC0_9BACL|nr:hypothetical protein [Cohnella nanjingensis]MBB6675358.1 hypothetical protein [Cohnella nanjingensis]